jgi:O-succinylhomoserine sulfhydrylase
MKKGGALVAFELEGGLDQGQRFLNALEMCSLTANLGDTKTIVSHPASTTHSRMTEEDRLAVGISNSFIRISAGLENVEDILTDIDKGLSILK